MCFRSRRRPLEADRGSIILCHEWAPCTHQPSSAQRTDLQEGQVDTRIWSGDEARSDTEHSLFGHDSPDVNVLHEVLVLFLLPADDTVEGLCPASSEQKGIKKSWSEGPDSTREEAVSIVFSSRWVTCCHWPNVHNGFINVNIGRFLSPHSSQLHGPGEECPLRR